MGKQILVAAAVAAVAIIAAGCNDLGGHMADHRAEIKIKGKVLVVPFRDAQAYYYDSEDGGPITDAAVIALQTQAGDKITCVDYGKVRGMLRGAFATKEDISWTDVGRAAGADYVVYGTLNSINWEDPNTPGMPRCSFSITYYVHDVAHAKRVYGVTKAGFFPVTIVGNWGVSAAALSVEALKPKAYIYIGRNVANSFVTMTIDKREEATTIVQKMK